ncbi:NAD(P)/FAD-dependent oxidoreductase [Tateyamaria omphalii]|uniref:NAD(P)/FAD-dependent oxidoreductase n=1 Tax=Tateyamaria omphalii TaxID=299262 RepID=UPI001C9958DA|nr:NAD(P)/FAD-dependent oxidoreductase [Tateyamaria omphalii]MBY5934957.1 NAD(P)/FAD-dependent oxidoreductase [Tateyamaria omphalii]
MQDVVIVGGSFGGLSAALQLGRASRTVAVVDAGAPRNRASEAAHGVPGWDGKPPGDILAAFKADVQRYPSVTRCDGEVVSVGGDRDNFEITLASGETIPARRIILAHGVADMLPDLPGCDQAWGKSLLHCPYCHGFEVRGRPLAVLANHAMSGHQVELLRADWSDDVTVLTGVTGDFEAAGSLSDGLKADPRFVERLNLTATGISVVFDDGAQSEFAAVFAAPRISLSGTPADMLGCASASGPLGPFVQTGPMGQTSVDGVFAAGDCARPSHNVTSAIGDGATAGIGCHQSLVFPQLIQPLEAAA